MDLLSNLIELAPIFQVVPLTTGYLASAGALHTKESGVKRAETLGAGALPDTSDPVCDCCFAKFKVVSLKNSICICKGLRIVFCSIEGILMIFSIQSKEAFRALLRSDTGQVVPFVTLLNRSQVYKKLTGRRLASAQLNLKR
jgi:hypothetical protein